MFNLIIAIISIALVTLISAAGIYYGGASFTSNSVEAKAAKMRNERNQLIAAVEIYKSDGNDLGSTFKLSTLVEGNYLVKIPDDWVAQNTYAYRELDKHNEGSMNVCYTANAQDGYTYTTDDTDVVAVPDKKNAAVPYCSKSDLPVMISCCISE